MISKRSVKHPAVRTAGSKKRVFTEALSFLIFYVTIRRKSLKNGGEVIRWT